MRSLLSHPKKIFTFFFSPRIKISGKNIIFHDEKINRSNFYKNKKLSNFYKNKKLSKIGDIDVNKILISKKEAYGKKS